MGPITFEELKTKFGNPFQRPQSDMVWAEGMDEWKQASEIEGLCGNAGPTLPAAETSGNEDWFYLQGDQQKGPVPLARLKEMMTDRALNPPLSMVWKPGMDQWKPIYLVAELSAPVVSPSFLSDFETSRDGAVPAAQEKPSQPEPKKANGNHVLPAQGVSVVSLAALEEEGAAPMTLEEKLRLVAASRTQESKAAAPANGFTPAPAENASFHVDEAFARSAEMERQAAEAARMRAEEEGRALTAAKARAEEERLAAEAARTRAQEEARLRELELENSRALAEELAAAERARAEAETARVAAVLKAREEEEAMAAAARARAEEEERAAAAARARVEEETRAAEAARMRIDEENRALEIARARAEEEARIRAEQEARMRAEQEALAAAEARAAAAAQARAEEEARARASEEARMGYEAEAKAAEEARLAAIAQAQAEEDSRARMWEQTRLRAEEEARLIEAARMEAATRARAEEEAAAAAARTRAEEEFRAREAEEARAAAAARAREEEDARAAAARGRAEEEARWRQEEEARIAAEKTRAEEEARNIEIARLASERAREEEVARLRQAEEARIASERAHAEEAARLIELARLAAERAKAEELAAAQVRARAEEETRVLAERAQAEDAARFAEQTRMEARMKAEQEIAAMARAKAEEEARIQQVEEAARAVERARAAEAARIMEQARVAALHAKAEEEARQRQAEEARLAAIVRSNAAATPANNPTVPQTGALAAEAPVSTPQGPQPTAGPAAETPANPASTKPRIPTGDSAKHVWYYTSEGEREGPVTFEDLRTLATGGGLDPRLDMVWKKGTPEWKPAGQIESLFEKRTESVETRESLAPPADSYVAPALNHTGADLNKDSGWPGARRRSFILVSLLLPVAWIVAMGFAAPLLGAQFGPELMGVLLPASQLVPFIFLIYIGLNRLVNLGMSRWWFLGNFVPLLGLWVGYRCFACPPGYAYHKKMDGAGIALAILYWLTIIAGLVIFAASIAVIFGALGNPELKQQILDFIREAAKQGAKR